jgi:cytochrome b subunit of formate dehydrogenase
MKTTLLAITFFPAILAAAEQPNPAERLDQCLACHDPGGDGVPSVSGEAFRASVHYKNDVACADCHEGYTPEHAGEALPALAPDDQAIVDRLSGASWGEGEAKKAVTSPRAYLACAGCHATETEAFAASIHGRWLREPRGAAGPVCASCHGDPHAVTALTPFDPKAGVREPIPADRRAMALRCESCHGNAGFAAAAGLDPAAPAAYHDSIHGRLVRVGSPFAPSCANCHAPPLARGGTHGILAKDDPASMVNPAHRRQACARCHENANDNFASLVAHKALHESGGAIPHLVHVAFSWLTTLTLLFFSFHVAVDFVYELRVRLSRRRGEAGSASDTARSVVRFDAHQRIQHAFMLTGVILLGLTGWPLRGAGSAEAAAHSRSFLALFGGVEGAAIWHRIGAVLIIISAAHHLAYLTFLAARKQLPLSMLPTPKDAVDLRDNVLFMLGLRKERPRFDRFTYLEKFDYWAVFWGMVMMVGTGFIFWFPAWFATWAPSWLITAAQIVHGEEATLAILFLFVVHFYNVHLKPSIFPMNWAWLNGRISLQDLKHEHPLEYERTKGEPKE